MKRPRVYRVRTIKVWEEDWTALSREEAIEMADSYHLSEGYNVESYNQVTAKVIRPATDDEMSDYWSDLAQGDEEE